jgi:hypothetical protein
MIAWLPLFGGVGFLGAIVAVHWVYFRSHCSGDGRLAIRLPLTLDPGVKHLMLRPAAQGSLSSAIRLQPNSVLVAAPYSLAQQRGSLAPSISPLIVAASAMPVANKAVDRVIVNDRYLLLEGIVTETELVCWGDVDIAAGSVIGACMKVRGNMYVGANVTFLGPVVVNGNIIAGENCVFLFDVVSKGEISFGKGTRLGSSTGELAIPVTLTRLADRQDDTDKLLSDLQYEMHYG